MTSTDIHVRKIAELLEELEDAIDRGIEERPITIGFMCSECSCQLLELYLHKLNKIKMGKIIKHNWFIPLQNGQKKESLIERKLPVDFPNKGKIFSLMQNIERNRITLVYGKSDREQIEDVLKNFNELKKIISSELKKMGVEIE